MARGSNCKRRSFSMRGGSMMTTSKNTNIGRCTFGNLVERWHLTADAFATLLDSITTTMAASMYNTKAFMSCKGKWISASSFITLAAIIVQRLELSLLGCIAYVDYNKQSSLKKCSPASNGGSIQSFLSHSPIPPANLPFNWNNASHIELLLPKYMKGDGTHI